MYQIYFADPPCRVFHPPASFHMDLFTVMGPGGRETPRDLLQPPKFDAHSDKFQWRKDVRLWVRLVRKLARGGDTKAIALSKALVEALYLSVDTASKHKLDYQINAGNLRMDDANTDDEQDRAIALTLDFLAKDSPHESVKRISKMMRNIYTCRRQPTESPYVYAKRFEGIVSQYLNHCHKSSLDQDNQVFVMVLLENSLLPQSVQDNLILQLTTSLRDPCETKATCPVTITKKSFEAIQEHAKNIDEKASEKNFEGIERYVSDLRALLLTIKSNAERVSSTERVKSYIKLEDAILAMSQIQCETTLPTEKRTIPITDAPPPKKALLSTPQSPPRFKNTQYTEFRKRKRSHGSPRDKKSSRCHACGMYGHWKGDTECRFYDQTKQEYTRPEQARGRNDTKAFFH